MNQNILKSAILCILACLYIPAFSQTQSFNPAEDAFIRGGQNKGENYDNHADGLAVKQGTVAEFYRKSVVKFDMSGFSLENAGSAVLRLYCYKIERNDVITTIDAYAISNDWDEGTVTWETAPVFNQVKGSAVAVVNDYIDLRVSDYVKEAIANNDAEISFGLYDRGASNNGVFFHDKSGENPPVLVIDVEEDSDPGELTGTYYVDAADGDDSNDGL